ncbi:MAG: glycoside hydrolase family 172 protein [Candidatus Dormibacteria bacterium]
MTFAFDRLAHVADEESRSISAENPDGAKGGGGRAEPSGDLHPARSLGRGWKVRPCIPLPAGSTTTLADIDGPGTIRHIWMTVDTNALRGCVLRVHWNGVASPSVEVPLGDFFANGHGVRSVVNSMPVAVYPTGGLNSYWPMPFQQHCTITIENQLPEDIPSLYYQVDYSLGAVAEEAALFHAQWRRSLTTREHPEHVILDGVRGRGHYVGTYLAWTQMSDGWWGEGEMKFFIDGDTDHPTYCGTGTEDYFGGAWCFGALGEAPPQTYSGPFLGYPQWTAPEGKVPKHGLYRWHIPDPIRFREDLRVTVQALGWWPRWEFQPLTDDIASVAYWYQTTASTGFPPLPGLAARYER